MNTRIWAMLAVTLASLAPCSAAAAFQCPAADSKVDDRSALTADDVAEDTGPLSEKLKAAVHSMRVDGVKSGDIVDRLVVADCKRVDAASDLSDNAKAARVRRFASKVANYIYFRTTSDEEDIMVDVPVPASLYGQMDQAAKKAKLSEDAWVNQAIQAHLSTP